MREAYVEHGARDGSAQKVVSKIHIRRLVGGKCTGQRRRDGSSQLIIIDNEAVDAISGPVSRNGARETIVLKLNNLK